MRITIQPLLAALLLCGGTAAGPALAQTATPAASAPPPAADQRC